MKYIHAVDITLTEEEVEDFALGMTTNPYRVRWMAEIDTHLMISTPIAGKPGAEHRAGERITMRRYGKTAQDAYVALANAITDEGWVIQ